MTSLHRAPVPHINRAYLRQFTRAAKIAAVGHARGLTGRKGDLPTFIIIGAQRGGTTSMYNYLAQHPQIRTPHAKELHYFSLYYRRSLDWYRGNFPSLAPGEVSFEATPLYLFDERVPPRVAADLPETKFMVLLRNPVSRAYSQYQHNRKHGIEPLSFEDAIAAEPERLAHGSQTDTYFSRRMRRLYGYLERGQYAVQLRRWFDVIDPSRFLILRSEDLYRDPQATLDVALGFVGVEPYDDVVFARHNGSAVSQSRMSDELKAELTARFEQPNADLAALLGWSSTWGSPRSGLGQAAEVGSSAKAERSSS